MCQRPNLIRNVLSPDISTVYVECNMKMYVLQGGLPIGSVGDVDAAWEALRLWLKCRTEWKLFLFRNVEHIYHHLFHKEVRYNNQHGTVHARIKGSLGT
jgi:hypothetical protein